ncbi:MarR family winged helix-turn-helix transcriptional regulator [Cytobacillus horneckiae]|uniref:MarR family winged helix-turn-helix transcriptional regulator n=1 Tax=Cytobacillus horneckiae TaxID=549687 RepID=UPI002041A946|nr:MarR family winged helix-turn-helix transcriptional regulator [Cytobacillus horneckiae]MCM3176787.1 MarR family winged helix-turn-helix transcriptional regulator [Cytobacillus horneckiae]
MSKECYCIPLRTASRKVSAYYNRALEPVGVNIAQFSMLRKIRRAYMITITELSKVCELDRSTVGRNVKVLEKMEAVQLIPGDDQRETTVKLTDHGHQILKDGDDLWEQAQVDIEEKLGGKDNVDNLLELLKRF